MGAEVSANNNEYTKFNRIVIRGGHPYYVDDLRVIPSDDRYYGNENWSLLNITNISYNEGSAYTFDGEYFNSNSNAIYWHNIQLNTSNNKAQLNFTLLSYLSHNL